MFRRKSAAQSKALLEYLANATLEKQRASKHVIAQLAVVHEKNAALESERSLLENLLKGALDREPFIDLDSLKKAPRIPAFAGKRPHRHGYLPMPLSGFESLFPWKRRAYREQYEAAEAKYKKDRHDYKEALSEHQKRVAQEEVEVQAHNAEIELFKGDLAAGKPKAVADYFTLVLQESAYPAGFPTQTEIAFAPEAATLCVEYALPAAGVIPEVKIYKYDKDRDEIIRTATPQKRRQLLYASMLAQISLRTLYEIFKADRREKVNRIEFKGYVDGISPSTGQPGRFCLIALNITRGQFDSLDLRRVEPLSCLKGLKARLSSEPDQLLAVPPVTLDNPQDDTISDAAAIPYPKQRISELENIIQAQGLQITELERKLAAQNDRLAEVVPELRDKRERSAELQAEIQGQKDYIAELENRIEAQNDDSLALEAKATEEPGDTQPTETIAEMTAAKDFAEAGIFTPIASETPEDGAGGARIPPHEPEAQASKDLAQPSLLEIMSVFVEAQVRYVDYIGEGLPKEQINRLAREGRLERHKFHTYKLRATQAGKEWYSERSMQQAPPAQDTGADLPQTAQLVEKTVTLRSLLLGDADDQADEPASALADMDGRSGLTASTFALPQPVGREALIDIVGSPQSDSARLLALMMQTSWRSSADVLQPAFPDEFVNVIVEEINERAHDNIGENFIFEEAGRWIGHEDYCQDIETIIALPEYRHLRHS